jgi:hypothetical protein
MKCPLCSVGEVVIGDPVDLSLKKLVGDDAKYATCSNCTAGGVVTGGVLMLWMVRTENGNPIKRKVTNMWKYEVESEWPVLEYEAGGIKLATFREPKITELANIVEHELPAPTTSDVSLQDKISEIITRGVLSKGSSVLAREILETVIGHYKSESR